MASLKPKTIGTLLHQVPYSLTDGATVTPDLAYGTTFSLTAGGSRTIAAPLCLGQATTVTANKGTVITFQIKNSLGAGAAMTTTWNAVYIFQTPWVDPPNNSTYSVSFLNTDGSNWQEITARPVQRYPRVAAKTANYTLLLSDLNNCLFTNRGAAGAVTFTLPTVTAAMSGSYVTFVAVANQNMIVAGSAGELVTFNDAAANSVAFQTGGEIIGGRFDAFCDGTSWIISIIAEESQTVTVTT